eukprot:CAMPEP_0198144604 /NCGR_PEP_ID=MMETSP1443-20131203/16869_1 /TAXON_ID=186043 /ORGANISM="Entomoneis sp., Strain CCMP2396" /LENGTH=357 /DNA_ID=CAMNT_0043808021 /DNA_START=12 /DNA_END=1085 /DNA_ORIENTATION=+
MHEPQETKNRRFSRRGLGGLLGLGSHKLRQPGNYENKSSAEHKANRSTLSSFHGAHSKSSKEQRRVISKRRISERVIEEVSCSACDAIEVEIRAQKWGRSRVGKAVISATSAILNDCMNPKLFISKQIEEKREHASKLYHKLKFAKTKSRKLVDPRGRSNIGDMDSIIHSTGSTCSITEASKTEILPEIFERDLSSLSESSAEDEMDYLLYREGVLETASVSEASSSDGISRDSSAASRLGIVLSCSRSYDDSSSDDSGSSSTGFSDASSSDDISQDSSTTSRLGIVLSFSRSCDKSSSKDFNSDEDDGNSSARSSDSESDYDYGKKVVVKLEDDFALSCEGSLASSAASTQVDQLC